MKLYAGSDGRYYTDWQVSWRFENDEWRPCMWDSDEGWELVEDGNDLVWLYPEDTEGIENLPDWAELRQRDPGVAIVDVRTEDDGDGDGGDDDREKPGRRVEGGTP